MTVAYEHLVEMNTFNFTTLTPKTSASYYCLFSTDDIISTILIKISAMWPVATQYLQNYNYNQTIVWNNMIHYNKIF